MPIALAPFDPSRDFVAKTNFRAAGTVWHRALPFDKTVVNERVLRQLYEARKVSYASNETAPEPELSPEPGGDLTPVEQHEAVLAAEQETAPGATADAAEGPKALAGDAGTDGTGEPQTPEAAAPSPPDRDGDGRAGGSKPDDTGTPEELVKRLVKRHTHDELFTKASGLAGVTKDQTKTQIAEALVKAGRVGDGTA